MPTNALLVERALAKIELERRSVFADPWHAVKQGWVITLDEKPPEGVAPMRPMPADEYLEAVTRLWMQSTRGMLCKTRQLMVTWLFAWLHLWEAIARPGSHCLFQGKRLDDVDAGNEHRMLGRARFIRKHLPIWLQPEVVSENTTSETYANKSCLEAIPEGGDVIRSKAPSSVVMDELAFHEAGENAWNAANACAKRQWGITTPNGHEFVYRQAEMGRPWDDWRKWPSVMRGLHGYVNAKGVQLVFLSWEADPKRCTVEADASRRAGYTNVRDFLREQMGDFSLAEGLGVYANEFSQAVHVIPQYRPDPMSPVYRGWDFGYNGQSVAFFQTNHLGQLVWFDQIILKAVPLERVIQEARRRTLNWLGTSPMTIGMDHLTTRVDAQVMDYGDPSGEAHNTNGQTDAATLSKHGIRLISKPTTGRKRDLVENIRALLLPRSDGKPALLVAKNSPEMDHVVAGFSGGYHYAKPPEGKAEKELPHKDGLYDHVFDAAQYAVDNISPIRFGRPADEPDPDWWREPEPGIGQELYA